LAGKVPLASLLVTLAHFLWRLRQYTAQSRYMAHLPPGARVAPDRASLLTRMIRSIPLLDLAGLDHFIIGLDNTIEIAPPRSPKNRDPGSGQKQRCHGAHDQHRHDDDQDTESKQRGYNENAKSQDDRAPSRENPDTR
jgi:hypothetical protein